MRAFGIPVWAAAVLQAGILLSASACQPGPRVARPAGDATISGIVRGPDVAVPIEGRTVTLVNLATGKRRHTATSHSGGFSFTVEPGRYRLDVAVRDGELILTRPDVIEAGPRDVDAGADFVIAPTHVVRPRFRAPRGDDGLGAGIA